MPAGLERDALYHKMARRIDVLGVARIAYARYRNMLAQPTVVGLSTSTARRCRPAGAT